MNVVRTSFQLMVAIGFAFLGLGAWLAFAWRRRRALPRSRWFLRAVGRSPGPAAVLALECGWVVTEVGRQPWIVYHVMRTRDAVSDASGLRYGYFLLDRGLHRAHGRDVHGAAAPGAGSAARRPRQ